MPVQVSLSVQRHFFILSLWLQPAERASQSPTWRIVMQDALTAERHGFSTLSELMAYLDGWMNQEVARRDE